MPRISGQQTVSNLKYLNQKLIAVGSIQSPLITLQMEHRVHAFLD